MHYFIEFDVMNLDVMIFHNVAGNIGLFFKKYIPDISKTFTGVTKAK